MPFNISEFQSQIATRGFLPSNKFQMTFNLPPAFSRQEADFPRYNSMVRDIGLWVDATTVPAMMLQTQEVRRYGYGATEKRPIVPVFGDVQLRIIADGAGMTWELFRRWIQKVNNSDSQVGMNRQPGLTTTEQARGVPMNAYESSYPTDYTTSLVLSVYNAVGGEQKRIIMNQSFPSALSPMELGWDNNNNLCRFSVNLSMQDWYIELT